MKEWAGEGGRMVEVEVEVEVEAEAWCWGRVC